MIATGLNRTLPFSMSLSAMFASRKAPLDTRPDGTPQLIVRLRWLAIIAQAITIVAVAWGWRADLPLVELFAVLAFAAGSNVVFALSSRLHNETTIGVILIIDVGFLTGLLALTGGPANPFSVLYLIHVMLAAIIAGPRWTWATVLASSAGFATLFFAARPLPVALGGGHHEHGATSFSLHLQGMWLAYTIAAVTIAAFVSQLSKALRREREDRAHAARMLGLATLAAGAAHEIGNPLATIRIVAEDLQDNEGLAAEVVEDLKLIDREVGRADEVLRRMATGAGELSGETPIPTDVGQLLRSAVALLGDDAYRVRLELTEPIPEMRLPVEASSQALVHILRNAVQASPPEETVLCDARYTGDGLSICIVDRGAGMPGDVLDRIGEPFFSTREGRGMGLGVFIARSLIEHLGGRIQFRSATTKGTEVSIWLPAVAGASA